MSNDPWPQAKSNFFNRAIVSNGQIGNSNPETTEDEVMRIANSMNERDVTSTGEIRDVNDLNNGISGMLNNMPDISDTQSLSDFNPPNDIDKLANSGYKYLIKNKNGGYIEKDISDVKEDP